MDLDNFFYGSRKPLITGYRCDESWIYIYFIFFDGPSWCWIVARSFGASESCENVTKNKLFHGRIFIPRNPALFQQFNSSFPCFSFLFISKDFYLFIFFFHLPKCHVLPRCLWPFFFFFIETLSSRVFKEQLKNHDAKSSLFDFFFLIHLFFYSPIVNFFLLLL